MSTRVDTGSDSSGPARRLPALRWLGHFAVLVVLAAATLWVHLYEFNGPNTWDSALYLTMGKLLQRGLRLYRDMWEMKPPGIFMYESAVFAILPVEVWSLRLTDYLLYVVAAVLFYRLCAVEARWPLALAATVVWLYFAHHPIFNNNGFYTEEYLSMGSIAAVAAAARYWRGGGLGWVAVSGVALAGAIIFKHPGVACAAPAAILISARRPLRALLLFALCAALPLLLVVAYFWWRGALAEFLDCNLFFLLVYGGVTQPNAPGVVARVQELAWRTQQVFAPYPVLIWTTAFGSAVCALRPNRFRLAALTWMLLDLLMIGAQKYYYEHYFIQVFASAILVDVLGVAWLLQRRPAERWWVSVPRLALGVAAVALAWLRLQTVIAERQPVVARSWAAVRAGPSAWPHHPAGPFEVEIGRYMNERTVPGDRVFSYSTGSGVAVYWTAERLPASRYLYPNASASSPAREAEQRAELERTRPAYVVIEGNPVYRHFTPFLLAHYTLAAVKVRDYRLEIWVRNELAPLAAGTRAGLVEDPRRGGLVLQAPGAPGDVPLGAPSEARHGSWTSPAIEVVGGGGDLALDWNPRADLASNPTGLGFPAAEASAVLAPDDAKTVLGAPTLYGRWSTAPDSEPQSLTVRLGAVAVSDRVVLRGALDPADTPAARLQVLAAADGDFGPLAGTWEPGANGAWIYRFAPQALSAVRIVVEPARPARGVVLQRVQVPAVGMGVGVRYRTGPTPDLAEAPWVAVEDGEGPQVVHAQRYVQIQCDVWSGYEGRSPVLRALQIGRLRFQLDGGAAVPQAPLRTARRMAGAAAQCS